MSSDAFNKQETLTAEEGLQPKLVTVEIAGKTHQVPAGITLMKALWYTGHDVVRGAGPAEPTTERKTIPRLKPA